MQRFEPEVEQYLSRYDYNIHRYMEKHGLIVHEVHSLPAAPRQDGTLTWHLRPADGLDSNFRVYIDGSAMLALHGPFRLCRRGL